MMKKKRYSKIIVLLMAVICVCTSVMSVHAVNNKVKLKVDVTVKNNDKSRVRDNYDGVIGIYEYSNGKCGKLVCKKDLKSFDVVYTLGVPTSKRISKNTISKTLNDKKSYKAVVVVTSNAGTGSKKYRVTQTKTFTFKGKTDNVSKKLTFEAKKMKK